MIIKAFNDIKAKFFPKKEAYDQMLLRKYLEGELQNPIMATTRRPAYRAIVSPTPGGTDFIDLQKAIDFVNELGGGTIFVKAGIYILTSNINLYSNIELIGEDNNTAILDFSAGDYKIQALGSVGSRLNNIHIENIQVRNSRVAYTNGYGATLFNYCDDISVKNCHFTNNVGAGINVIAAQNILPLAANSVILGRSTADAGQGPYTELSQGFKVTESKVAIQAYLYLKRNGTFPEETYNIWLEIQGDSGGMPDGVAISTSLNRDASGIGTSGSWEIFEEFDGTDALVVGTQYHLVLKGNFPASDVNNIVWYNSASSGNSYANGEPAGKKAGVWEDTTEDDFNFKLEYNPIDSKYSTDIYIRYSNRFQVERNYSFDSQFLLLTQSTHGNIVDNYVDGYSANAVSNCKHIWISGCSKIKVMRNTVIGSSDHGIYHNNMSTNNYYAFNHLEDCATRGIYIESGGKNFIVNNYILKTTVGAYGINTYISDDSVVSGNVVVGVTQNGITVSATTGHTIVSNNVVKGAGNKGIFIVSDNIVIVGNTATGCLVGMFIDSTSNKCVIIANHLRDSTTPLTNNSPDSIVDHNVIT